MKYQHRFLALILVLFILPLSACSARPERINWSLSGKYNSYAEIIYANVPFVVMPSYNMPYDWIQIVEEDQYGRVLFVYETISFMFGETTDTLLCVGICQKKSTQDVYFYEDICYLLALGKIEDYKSLFSTEDISELKQWNDWGIPLDETKMTKVDYKGKNNTSKIVGDYMSETIDSVTVDLCAHLGITHAEATIFHFCFGTNQNIWVASVSTTNSEKPSLYVFNYSSDEGIMAAQELQEPLRCQEQIVDFKNTHGG